MQPYNIKKIIIILIYISFFITIPIIKNKSRLLEKKIQSYESGIFILEIYSNIEEFTSAQKKITKISINEK